MMQNAFRRIALAQGLLPERPPVRESPMRVEPSDALPPHEADAAAIRSDAWEGGIERPVGNSA